MSKYADPLRLDGFTRFAVDDLTRKLRSLGGPWSKVLLSYGQDETGAYNKIHVIKLGAEGTPQLHTTRQKIMDRLANGPQASAAPPKAAVDRYMKDLVWLTARQKELAGAMPEQRDFLEGAVNQLSRSTSDAEAKYGRDVIRDLAAQRQAASRKYKQYDTGLLPKQRRAKSA